MNGPNALPSPHPVSLLTRIITALREPLVLVLLAAMALTILSRDAADTAIIALVVLVNTTLAVRQEVRSERDARALAGLVSLTSRAVRDGRVTDVPSTELVPGDLVVLRAGDLVPADCHLVQGVDLAVDESALTGESLPVDKEADGAPELARLSSGTAVLHGRGRAVVTETGPDSALGRIAGLMTSKPAPTPLQRRMSQLSLGLAAGVIVLCGVILALGLLRGQPWETMVLAAVSLAVAAVPESLPAVVTITLALAARRMATRHAVVRRLAAVETSERCWTAAGPTNATGPKSLGQADGRLHSDGMSSTQPDFTPTDSTSTHHPEELDQRSGYNDAELRRLALKRLEDKRGLMAHALAYVLVNLLLVAIWKASGAGFFWPVFPIFGWGIGLAFHAWSVFWPEPGPTQIDREIERIKRRR